MQLFARTSGLFAGMLPVIFLLLFHISCNRNYVAVEYTNASGEVEPLANLVFRFNKPLHPDSLLNRWDSTEYISFKPAIPGKFRWSSPDELVFSPSAPLNPATSYKAKLKKELLQYSEYGDMRDEKNISFHTPPLQLADAQISWVQAEGQGQTAMPRLMLRFNYPVSLEELREKITITVEGQKPELAFQSAGTASAVNIALKGFRAEDRDYQASITIGKGLKPHRGQNPLEEDISTILSVSSPYVLSISNIESEHTGTEGLVHIYTSQQVNAGNVSEYIRFRPAVNYTVTREDFGITIRSEKFDADAAYTITVSKGLKGSIGGVLKEEYSTAVAFGRLEPDISFRDGKAVYLSRLGSGNMEVSITNTARVKLVISRIYENNLLMAERYGYRPQEASYDGDDYEDYYDYGYSGNMAGDVIYSREIDVRSLPRSGSSRILNLSRFEDRMPELRGIYHVMIRSMDNYWVRDSRFISYSDIGLIAKQGTGTVHVFANSIKTARPSEGVTISIYGANNQLMGSGATDGEGVAVIRLQSSDLAGFTPAMVIAKTADDFTWLPLKSTRVNTSRFDVGGKRISRSAMDAFIYPERDIYRPGERVNYSVILRNSDWTVPEAIPLKLKFLMPNGREFKSFRKTINDQGALDGSIDMPESVITGSYTLEVYTSNDIFLASKNIMVEEFVPDRIRLNASLDREFMVTGGKYTLRINAMNFFGPPAANRNFETEIQIRQKQFSARKFPGFDFTLANGSSFFDKIVREGKTDADGNAAVDFTVPAMYANSGLLQASFYSTVFDETGRPVSRHVSADIYTQNVFFGIKDDGYHYYPLNQPVKFHLVAVNRQGDAVQAVAKVQVIRNEYNTVLVRSGRYYRYESQREQKIISEENMTVGAGSSIVHIPRIPGSYEVRVYLPGASTYVRRPFYSYGSWGNAGTSFEVNREGHIDIDTDRESYAPGEVAKLHFRTPFNGRLLVTTESDGVLSYQYVDVVRRTASLEMKFTSANVPNVYITATLIRPHEISDIPLTVAYGFRPLRVEEKSRKIAVEIRASEKSRSGKRQKVQVKAVPGSYITLAAVDNGVLQVTDFKTPDPYAYFYQKRALQVNAYDIYPLLFPELRQFSSTGGDGDLSLEKRVNPMPAKRFRIMSYWSGIRKTNASGIAEFEFDIPQFNGQVRLMAVAFRNEKFGSAEATITVADPVVISTALPRFISPGDTVTVPVTLANTTASNATGTASITVSGPLSISGPATQQISIGPNSETATGFRITTGLETGVARMQVNISALGEKFTEVTEISVRPPSTLQKFSGSGSVAGGATERISIPSRNLIPGSFNYEIVISRSPVTEIADQLRYLVQYPYGCTEQIVSATFPQLYYGDLVDAMGLNREKAGAYSNVTEAIRRIKMRQLYNGALTLWEGNGYADWWATAYAAHFLLEAGKAGYDVEKNLVEPMLSYLVNRLKAREVINYYYNRDQNKKIAPKEVAYSLYILAMAGRPQVSTMNYYKARPEFLALDSRYLLSAAYAVAGDRRAFASLLPASFSGEESVQQTGGSFYSPLRDEAIALNALLEVDPGNSQIPVMAKHVADRLKSERYLNTQERSFSFLALGKLARSAAEGNATAEVYSGGKKVATVDKIWRGNSSRLSPDLQLAVKGTGRIYYSWVAEGISSTGDYLEEDRYIRVRRNFYDRNGRLLRDNHFTQNELIIVELVLEKTWSSTIQNIVITDLLPAGFEIENPRTKELPGMDWIRNQSDPVALDIRDDRIHFFVDAQAPVQRYYYAVRAVSPGIFRQGPVSADAMYAGEIHSYHGAQTIRVSARE